MELQATIVYQKNWHAIHALNDDGSRKFRYIINEGSSRSSKTVSLIDCYDLYARANENKRLTVWRDTKTDCKKTVLNDALKRLKKTNRYKVDFDYNKTESILTYDTDSTFEIHGTDDEETVHGLEQDACWFNEPYKISRDTFDQIDQRTSDFVFIDWNPKKDHWIDDLKKDPRTIVIHSTFKDNPFCPIEQRTKILSYQPVKYSQVVIDSKISEHDAKNYDLVANKSLFTQKELKELQRCCLNEDKNSANDFKWQVYGLGLKAEKPERIFNWKEIPYSQYLSINSKLYYGVDWGKVDPFGICEYKFYDNKLFVHELNYLSEDQLRDKMTPQEIQHTKSKEEGIVSWLFTKLNIPTNNDVICDNNRPLKIIALRKAGWERAVSAQKIAGSVNDGIELLENIEVYFTSASTNVKHEQENYSWKKDRMGKVLEEPEDLYNHTIDPTRYVALHLQKLGIIKMV